MQCLKLGLTFMALGLISCGGGGGTESGSQEPLTDIDEPGDLDNISALEIGNNWVYKNINSEGAYDYLEYLNAVVTDRLGAIYHYNYRVISVVEDSESLEYLGVEPEGLAFYGPLDESELSDISDVPLTYYAFFGLDPGQSRNYQLLDMLLEEDLDGDGVFETLSIDTDITRLEDLSLNTAMGVMDDVQSFEIGFTLTIDTSTGISSSVSEDISHWRAPGIGMVKEQSSFHDVEIMGYDVGADKRGFSNMELVAGDYQRGHYVFDPAFVKGDSTHILLYSLMGESNTLYSKILNESGTFLDTLNSYGVGVAQNAGITGIWFKDQFKVVYMSGSDIRILSLDSNGNSLDVDPTGQQVIAKSPSKIGIATDGSNIAVISVIGATTSNNPLISYSIINESGDISEEKFLVGDFSIDTIDHWPDPALYFDGTDFIVVFSKHNLSTSDYDLYAQRLSEEASNEPAFLTSTDGRWGDMQVINIDGEYHVFSGAPGSDNFSLIGIDSSSETIVATEVIEVTETPVILGSEEDTYIWEKYLYGNGARTLLENGDSYVIWTHGVHSMLLGARHTSE